MKLEVDLDELGASLIAAPPEAAIVASKARKVTALDATWAERMSTRAVEAEDNLWSMVNDQDAGLTDKDRAKILVWYATNHPEQTRRPEFNFNMVGGQVIIDANMLNQANAAAAECLLPPASDVIDIRKSDGSN